MISLFLKHTYTNTHILKNINAHGHSCSRTCEQHPQDRFYSQSQAYHPGTHTVFWRTTSIGHTFWVIATIKSFIHDYSSILLILKVTESIMCWSAGSDCVLNELFTWGLQRQRLTECQLLVDEWICWTQERWIYWTQMLWLHCAPTHAMQRVNMFSCVCIAILHSLQTHRWLV